MPLRAQGFLPSAPDGTRIYAVGDIHGRADLLQALLMLIDADLRANPIAQSVQVFLGDYIDRGPQSREVIELLVGRKGRHTMLCLRGNHETIATQFLNNPQTLSSWRQMGGINTLLSYGVDPTTSDDPDVQQGVAMAFRRALPESHRRFMEGLALSFTCGDYFFAHAGARPGIPLRQQSRRDLLWIREEFLLHEEAFGKVVVHGHTPTVDPVIKANRISIDTGAYATGRLTCVVLEGQRIRFIRT